MKKIILLVFIISMNNLYSGAPPVDDKPLPPPPYSINEAKMLTTQVEWHKDSLKKFLPESYLNKINYKGGFMIFNSKKKQDFYPASGAFAWVNLSNNEKFIFFSSYGTNKLINRIMKRIYASDSKLGSNKVMVMNEKISVRANIEKKNVINISAKVIGKCDSQNGTEVYSSPVKKNIVYINIKWDATKACKVSIENINFGSLLAGLSILEYNNAKILEGVNLSYLAPILKKLK